MTTKIVGPIFTITGQAELFRKKIIELGELSTPRLEERFGKLQKFYNNRKNEIDTLADDICESPEDLLDGTRINPMDIRGRDIYLLRAAITEYTFEAMRD